MIEQQHQNDAAGGQPRLTVMLGWKPIDCAPKARRDKITLPALANR